MPGLRYLTRTRGLKVLVGLQVVNTTERETPRDLDGVPFDAPRMKERFRSLVDALRPHLDRNVAYLYIGNELDMYFARQPGSSESYTSFYEDAVAYVHEVLPWITVGVPTTSGGAIRSAVRNDAAHNRVSDVHIHTDYGVHGPCLARPVNAPLADFPRLVRLAHGRPVVFQEVGYPEAPQLGSSEQKQAQFVTSVFDAWRRAGNRIPFLSFYALHDLPQRTCDEIAGYYKRAGSANLKAFLCSLGLRHENGAPKAAWSAFVKGASALR